MRFLWDQDDPEDGKGGRSVREMLPRLAPLFRPHRPVVAAGVALMLLFTAADVAGPLVLRHLIDVEIASGSRTGIAASAAVFLGLFLLARGAQYLQIVLVARMGLKIVTGLKRRLFDHIMGLSMAFFDRRSPGQLLARVESDTERLLVLFTEVGLSLMGSLVILFATLAVMLVTDWRITAVVIAVLAPIGVLNVYFLRYLRRFYSRARKAYADISSVVTEHVQAVPVIQVYDLQDDAGRRLGECDGAYISAEAHANFRAYGFWGALSAIEVGIVMLVVYSASTELFGRAMQVGTLVLFVEYARRIFHPLLMFSEQINFMQRAFASADRVFDLLETASKTPEREGAIAELPKGFSELRFEDVGFVYEGGIRALEGLDLTVRRGERIALVGRSGGGKSTILKLLLRFHEPTAGRIALDGRDVRAYTHEAWRAGLGLVLQEIRLFPGTLRENLTVFRDDIGDGAIARALGIVQAGDVVERLGGLEAEIEEGGANLSLGERQLVSFARAIVRDPDLLLLDEATSSVDPGTEKRLQEALGRVLAGRTSITIAHRLSTVLGADRILLIDQGRLVDAGPHRELLRRSPLYAELCRLQLQGVDIEDGAEPVAARAEGRS